MLGSIDNHDDATWHNCHEAIAWYPLLEQVPEGNVAEGTVAYSAAAGAAVEVVVVAATLFAQMQLSFVRSHLPQFVPPLLCLS